MANSEKPGVFARLGAAITRTRNFVFNSLFLLLVVFILVGLVNSFQTYSVPQNSALVLNPKGVMVEERAVPDPLQEWLISGSTQQEVELGDLLNALESAAIDEKIRMLVLDLDELAWASPAQSQRLGEAINNFKATGKKVVAYGYYYTQPQYHIASFADALYMHPMGQAILTGYGGLSLYFKDLLDKLNVNVHVFRVGDFKSAVEPVTRNDMSEEARLASEVLYQGLWQQLQQDIADNRKLSLEQVDSYAQQLDQQLQQTAGDMARAALENHLIDELLTADQARVRMGEEVGFKSTGDINGIDYSTYLQARDMTTVAQSGESQVAVIVAQGPIVAGRENGRFAASDNLVDLIRQAKSDDAIKAVVLRVDSPGGSAFASELIRQELELLQLAGKPVVASFGSVAASGGYWISATADAIVAEATTITGSIGIFSLFASFEDSLREYGVYSDGVTTTPLTGGIDPISGVSQGMAAVLQASVEHGYEQFIDLVARGRNRPKAEIEQIAQGRVWSGEDAMGIGLVDELGGMKTAVAKAAQLAELDDWQVRRLRTPLDPRNALLMQFMESHSGVAASDLFDLPSNSLNNRLWQQLQTAAHLLQQFNDPAYVYALCEVCPSIH